MPVKIVGSEGRELGVIGGDQGNFHIGNGDGLVAIIGDDKEDGQQAALGEINGKDFRLGRGVVGIGGNTDLLVAMKIMRGIVDRRLRLWFDEIFRGQDDGDEQAHG